MMAEEITETLTPTDFAKVGTADDLSRIDMGNELASLIESVLQKRIAERDALQGHFDSTLALYKEKVAELKVVSQDHVKYQHVRDLKKLRKDALELAEDLRNKKDELDRLDRLIEELDEYLEQL
jgi:propanediol dehydratase small subunit